MSVIYGIVLAPLYLGWIMYQAFIKRDLRQHMNDLYGLTFLVSVWAIIYYLIFF